MTGCIERLRRLRGDQRGVAAAEMALIASVFAFAVLNAAEIARYAHVLMEAGQATQAGAQAAYVACDSQHVPATTNCSDLTTAVTTAIQGTSLGSAVTLGQITEGYYCLDNSNKLVLAGDVSSKPSDCSAYGNSSLAPVLYLQVGTTYAFTPMFGDFSIGKTFPKQVTKTAWMRMQ